MSGHNQRPIANPIARLQQHNASVSRQQQGEDSSGAGASTSRGASEEETLQDRRRRVEAARILANYEQLLWAAMSRNESVVQTRLYFEAILAGLPSADPHVEWPTEYQEGTKSTHGKARVASDSRSKNRLSVGEGSSSSKKKDK